MENNNQNSIILRIPKKTDLNFILATFNKSVRKYSPLGQTTNSKTFFTEFPKIVDLLLAESEVLVAYAPEEPDVILGYIVYDIDPEVIHYIYIRETLQGLGIARKIIEQTFPYSTDKGIEFSINTEDAKKICKTHSFLIHNPFHLYKKEEHYG